MPQDRAWARAGTVGPDRRLPVPGAVRQDARPHQQRGSVLLLMPVAVLIVVLLGGVAVDSSVTFMAQRDLVDATEAAANDAATYGLDQDRLRAGGGYQLDGGRVEAAVTAAFVARGLGDAQPTVTVIAGDVVVTAKADVHLVFAGAIPGAGRSRRVTARAVGHPQGRR